MQFCTPKNKGNWEKDKLKYSLFFDDNSESKSLDDILQGYGADSECTIVLLIAGTSVNIIFQTATSF